MIQKSLHLNLAHIVKNWVATRMRMDITKSIHEPYNYNILQ